ncbi:16S rRNA (guanine(966)-N(2))-methyltransferase RsmD [Balneicella halophila]|uniref:16S rRNA (Guanine(966)-N(2))-methyltransferase RsmD n=1 Tax=Balneicella halophila TaxID=1537566 RepID=A0A7L4UMK5_BALHA|nr:RsmD family RNA methyltransferase [Balneicella halophila]PVX49365.1 16S rRNA (guanine(966)-N(2))-methyltransferase RsmD [Balneicella halophila]
MRIISGTHKGRRFQVGSKFKARPTTDFAKETLFNVLQNLYEFTDLAVLDLFSGTGGISYEFASRGANPIFSIEQNIKHYEYIRKNSEALGFGDSINTIKANVFSYLPKINQKFDIIFADPPFDMEETIKLPDLIFHHSLLNTDGIFIFEHSEDKDFSKHPHFERIVKRGSVYFSFFE